MSMIGRNLGSFECTALLGRGGMGEVYRAKDHKLGRDVAIKVLPEEFAKDADRVARFQREAKLLASLNHPNIASIYGLEKSGDTHFLVLELVEGDTLAERIKKGSIPVEESLTLALQIAEALEAAHEKGVIHRDLKPANIKITPEGKSKVLDFGLAKAFADEREDMILSNSPTLSMAATQQGVILGTAAYMSPEQAKGRSVDKRADVWAFGCVLYEMLTGRPVFEADDVSQTLARVLERHPDFSVLPANMHPKIVELLERCLEKEARNRYSGISDARVDIQKALSDPGGVFVQPGQKEEGRAKLRNILPWLAAVIVLTAVIAGAVGWYLRTPETPQVMRFDYHLPEDQEFTGGIYGNPVAVSADGTKIVYVANERLYLKNSNELEARPIQGTDEDPVDPFFSPDGQWVGYYSLAENQLKKIPVLGGASVTLCSDFGGAGASWGAVDMIVMGAQGSVMRVSANGGIPAEVVSGVGTWCVHPQMLQNGKAVLFAIMSPDGNKVVVQTLESEERKELFTGFPARYLPTGHIVYGLENNLCAIPFDPENLKVMGDPVLLVDGVYRMAPFAPTRAAISDSGTLVYVPGTTLQSNAARTLVWVDRKGSETPLQTEPGNYDDPRISPDGTKLALEIGSGFDGNIWIQDLVRNTRTRLTLSETSDILPLWVPPEGKRIAFASNRGGSYATYWKNADGTGSAELLASAQDRLLYPRSFSGDGKILVLGRSGGSTGDDIGMLTMGENQEIKMLLQDKYDELRPQISPDGKWIAYMSNESGRAEVYVRPFPDVSQGKSTVSTNGGDEPLWSPDGRELFFRGPDSIMVVPLETEPELRLGAPKILFPDNYSDGGWDIHPDGDRFVMLKPLAGADEESAERMPRKINIIVNWFEELKQRVPIQ